MSDELTPPEDTIINTLTSKIRDAQNIQTLFNDKLEKIREYLKKLKEIPSDNSGTLQRLLLQLRIDRVDVIKTLMGLDRSLCLALGIDPLHSKVQNLERALYALQEENIWHESHALADILGKLDYANTLLEKEKQQKQQERKLLRRLFAKLAKLTTPFHTDNLIFTDLNHEYLAEYTAEHLKEDLKYNESSEVNQVIEHDLHEAVELQANFEHSLEQLTEAFQHYEGLPKVVEINLNHIAKLEGPISEFHMAQQHIAGLINEITAKVFPVKNPPNPKQNLQLINALSNQLNNTTQLQRTLLHTDERQIQQLANLVARVDQQVTHQPSKLAAEEVKAKEIRGEELGEHIKERLAEEAHLARTIKWGH